jgi:hypothetical protein
MAQHVLAHHTAELAKPGNVSLRRLPFLLVFER